MHPNKKLFVEGVHLLMGRWAALRMAVEMGWGGCDSEQKSIEFADGLIRYFEEGGAKIDETDVEEILIETMGSQFSTQLEDDSEILIARSLCLLFRQSVRGETTFLDTLRKRNATPMETIEVLADDSSASEDE